MRAVGIVCEYNPFHLGHLYLIDACIRAIGEDAAIVCAMSGDFVQRGEAAVFDKFIRAEAACRAGADLVLELPLPWCLSSAEGFASGAVAMLDSLNCDFLAFGSERGDREALEKLAEFLGTPESLAEIRKRMDADAPLSFARARQLAAAETLGDAAVLLENPNDILGVEYLKALRKRDAGMQALVIRRRGAGHDSRGEGVFCSAMQLRKMLHGGEDPAPYIPREAMTVYRRAIEAGEMRDERLLETALLSRLYALTRENFDRLPDAGGGVGQRLYRALKQGGSFQQTASAASSKRLTLARMRRMLLCAALGVRKEDAEGTPPFIRVLAANERGRAFLREKRAESSIPVLIKPAGVRTLGARAEAIFALDAAAHDLYRLGCTPRVRAKPDADWRRNPTIV